MSKEIFRLLALAVIEGEPEQAENLAHQALNEGVDPLSCIDQGLTPGIQEVGERYSKGEYFLPELVIGAEAMKAALEILEPAMVEGESRDIAGRIVIGTVEGDIHEIGKTLVGTMLTANGFKVIDIGVDKTAEQFITAIEENDADLVGASALLTTTMVKQRELVEKMKVSGLSPRVKVLVGGAPVTRDYAEEIGADGYAEDAIAAVNTALRLMDAPSPL